MQSWADDTWEVLRPLRKGSYIGYADPELADWRMSYFSEESYKRLQNLKVRRGLCIYGTHRGTHSGGHATSNPGKEAACSLAAVFRIGRSASWSQGWWAVRWVLTTDCFDGKAANVGGSQQ